MVAKATIGVEHVGASASERLCRPDHHNGTDEDDLQAENFRELCFETQYATLLDASKDLREAAESQKPKPASFLRQAI